MTTDPVHAPAVEAPVAAVLIVDDSAVKRMALREMLAPLGHELVEADSGYAALRAVLRQDFAVILMDVRMPILDGYETAKLIRERGRSRLTPFIFVTAFGGEAAEAAEAYKSGAVDFVFTPVLPEVLQAKVSAFLHLHQQAQALRRSLNWITALHAALLESEVRAHAVLHNVADGIVTAGETGLIESFNPSAQRLFGYSDDEVLGQPLQFIVAPSHHDEFSDAARARWKLLTPDGVRAETSETVGCRKDGTCFAMEMDMSQMQIGERTFAIGCIRDISGRKAYTEALEHRTLHDDLTGLPNRTLFCDRVDRAIAYANRNDRTWGVLVVDLDDFQRVNETLGRHQGDAILQAVGRRLQGVLRDADTLARMEGDEFGILPGGEADVATVSAIAWKVGQAFERPFLVDEHSVDLEASIGIAFFPQHGRGSAELLRRAKLALLEAKHSESKLAVFAAEPKDETARRLTQLSELRTGIAGGELVLFFQPKIHLTTRQTIGVEALVRWQHPAQGLLLPGHFLPAAERSELIEHLTRWVLEEALRQVRLWTDAGLDITMAVNISAQSLARGSDLPDVVAKLTAAAGVKPGKLILELTESAAIDVDAAQALQRLHEMGYKIAIDDFGTGHSSLVYIQRLPIDQIKIDRSFVKNLAAVRSDAVIVRSIIDLAHNLDLSVVAEGVEDRGALDMLIANGCDSAQGYFFSRPTAADEINNWLARSSYGAPVGVGRTD